MIVVIFLQTIESKKQTNGMNGLKQQPDLTRELQPPLQRQAFPFYQILFLTPAIFRRDYRLNPGSGKYNKKPSS